jgi:sugar phosphate isomerase/epimerase
MTGTTLTADEALAAVSKAVRDRDELVTMLSCIVYGQCEEDVPGGVCEREDELMQKAIRLLAKMGAVYAVQDDKDIVAAKSVMARHELELQRRRRLSGALPAEPNGPAHVDVHPRTWQRRQ